MATNTRLGGNFMLLYLILRTKVRAPHWRKKDFFGNSRRLIKIPSKQFSTLFKKTAECQTFRGNFFFKFFFVKNIIKYRLLGIVTK